jgi:hypothetical protein
MALGVLNCRHHPARVGIGRCMSCQGTFCEECATRVDGILRCRDCLPKTEAAAAPPRARWRSLPAVAPALLLTPLAYLVVAYALYGLAAGLALLQSWRQGAPAP